MLRVLYLDCFSGVSGDMLLGALVELGVPVTELQQVAGAMGLDATVSAERVQRAGFAATLVRVVCSRQQHHRHLPEIEEIIRNARLDAAVAQRALAVFRRLAEAEATVHGRPIDEVHFHEVGAVDTLVDIVGVVHGIHRLGVDRVLASRVSVGGGSGEIAHGRVSIPAPGTAQLLKGVPIEGGPVEAELCTPTGAALLAELVDEFGPLPPMTLTAVGCGAGTRDFPRHPNILRAYLGAMEWAEPGEAQHIWVLECNLDDVPGELLGYAMERLLEAGALDVQVLQATGKKNRPAVLLRVLARDAEVRTLEEVLFLETGTLGLRRLRCARRTLPRRAAVVETPYGSISGKVARLPDGRERFCPEYESCRQAARRHGVPLQDVYAAARSAWEHAQREP